MQQGNNGTARLTDEQILDMESDADTGTASRLEARAPELPSDDDEAILEGKSGNSANDEAAADGEESVTENGKNNKSADAGEPAWVASLETQPEAAAEARRWRLAANDVTALDAAYFRGDADARAGLATRLYENDPAAFREMLVASARTLAARDPQGLTELAQQLGLPQEATPKVAKSLTQAARPAANGNREPKDTVQVESQSRADRDAAKFPADAYRTFEATTNEDVTRKIHDAIDRSLSRTLPEGVASGARRRMGEDIFREVHASLSEDRELAVRVGETLRDWQFDSAARQQIVSLVSSRARAVLPDVARRVVSEWTSSVLASDREKNTRIHAAASRRDITGGRLPEPVAGNAARHREVNYRRMSDEQILEM